MSDIVVDSSVVAKWILPEADSARALRLTTDVPAAGGRLFVLDLILPEVGNAIWKSQRQKLITLAEARKALVVLKDRLTWVDKLQWKNDLVEPPDWEMRIGELDK